MKRGAGTWGLALIGGIASVVTLAAGGCAQSSEPISAPPPAPSAQEDETPEDAAATCEAELDGDCGDCMKGACCEALTACEGDPDCAACVSGKDSDACEKTSETHERVDAYLTCKGGACASSCVDVKTGSCTGLLDDLVADDCAACLEKSCCEEVSACHGADVCWDGCFTNHDETKCHGDPDAHALFHAMGSCASEHCGSKCN